MKGITLVNENGKYKFKVKVWTLLRHPVASFRFMFQETKRLEEAGLV